jgi:hypothetical protein
MKKLLNSWKLYVGIIAVGFVIWVLAGFLFPPKHIIYESLQKGLTVPRPKSIYPEIKFWAETVGKCFVGIGGVAAAIKALLDLFRKKKDA